VHLREPDPSTRADLPSPDRPFAQYEGWEKYDFDYWRWDYEDFAEFFFGQCYTEPHSTKQIEDAVGWAREIGPEALILSDLAPYLEGNGTSVSPGRTVALTRSLATRIRCPALVIHGGADAIIDVGRGRALAEALGARFIQLDGVGHIPSGRHPVWFNLIIREFVESLPRDGR
jgi:pimeloyl-ACP methyl ester carboxylesterase